jgi:hypothetical protein
LDNNACGVCAVGDLLDKRPNAQGRKGWGFSSADMALLGLPNTVYLCEGTYEKNSTRFSQYIIPITAEECLALLK